MNIGLFGGTFDPVHKGHLALARAAMERCKLHKVYFVPANIPPHKQKQPLSPFGSQPSRHPFPNAAPSVQGTVTASSGMPIANTTGK